VPRARGGRLALRWRGPEDSELVGPDDLWPGDTLVVPSVYGGADRFGWAPALRGPVVAQRVRQFAAGCGLGERLALVLERAARLHDLGKADPRFQAMLYGDEVAAAAGELLAKSGMDREALFGPWRYEDPQHSLGWDPSAERLHALRSRSPTKDAPQGVAAAVWLAFEALPLFPCFLSGGSLVTRGFVRRGREYDQLLAH
jgi:hypothetical protein